MVSSGLRGYPFFSGNPKAPSFAERRTKFTTPRKPLEVRSSYLGMQLFLGHSLETVSKMVLVGPWRIYLVTFFQCIYRSYLLMCGLFGIMTQLGLVSSHCDHGTVVREIMLPPSLGSLALSCYRNTITGRESLLTNPTRIS